MAQPGRSMATAAVKVGASARPLTAASITAGVRRKKELMEPSMLVTLIL